MVLDEPLLDLVMVCLYSLSVKGLGFQTSYKTLKAIWFDV